MHATPCRYLYTHNYSVSPLTVGAVNLSCKRCCAWHGPCAASISSSVLCGVTCDLGSIIENQSIEETV